MVGPMAQSCSAMIKVPEVDQTSGERSPSNERVHEAQWQTVVKKPYIRRCAKNKEITLVEENSQKMLTLQLVMLILLLKRSQRDGFLRIEI